MTECGAPPTTPLDRSHGHSANDACLDHGCSRSRPLTPIARELRGQPPLAATSWGRENFAFEPVNFTQERGHIGRIKLTNSTAPLGEANDPTWVTRMGYPAYTSVLHIPGTSMCKVNGRWERPFPRAPSADAGGNGQFF